MIVSASRRTDIPSFYSEWMLNRLREGFVLVPGVRSPKKLGRAHLSPETTDCIVFWTKDPAPMMPRLNEIRNMGYRFYFEFTLNPYGDDPEGKTLEPGLPPVAGRVDTFRRLADDLGPERVDWRYDPVIVNDRFPPSYHADRFGELCAALSGHTERCVVSFLDVYAHIGKRFSGMTEAQMRAIARCFPAIAREYRLPLFTCAEEVELTDCGIGHGACIDREKIGRIVGSALALSKDRSQRPACNCVESLDVGIYDTCPRGCAYCYATTSAATVGRRNAAHDPTSPMLTGRPTGGETIVDRTGRNCRTQLRLW